MNHRDKLLVTSLACTLVGVSVVYATIRPQDLPTSQATACYEYTHAAQTLRLDSLLSMLESALETYLSPEHLPPDFELDTTCVLNLRRVKELDRNLIETCTLTRFGAVNRDTLYNYLAGNLAEHLAGCSFLTDTPQTRHTPFQESTTL